ncbi:hypothetical protein CAOG_08810 [Capsaspora owczarzaki ATCC 30864]|uniref:Uncharacterized protein n=1 Tax=Capsaspora owczarzaki (strain ATCC 30864) TaxID=595528 RepID=A0A0D2WRS7_CAPO3|nr:hypothetical protein CAOG_08810 [Capsaspora owczarzaki ATCC 30864]KJE94013.1 hypothetical protein CAOG_008810 [Capsaspora owczarzaki ATCC 30864]|eukprot:XP_011270450.1 hypothetical protein CAOG_08810 [Capsaspora owczarzaki ATCC 30864]
MEGATGARRRTAGSKTSTIPTAIVATPATPATANATATDASTAATAGATGQQPRVYDAQVEAALIAAQLPLGATLTVDHVPAYLSFNKHIKVGYRRPMTRWECIKSLFSWHNESINIWVHIFIFALYFRLLLNEVIAGPIMPDAEHAARLAAAEIAHPHHVHRDGDSWATDYLYALWDATYFDRLMALDTLDWNRLVSLFALSFIFGGSIIYHTFMPSCRSEVSYQRLLNFDVFGCVIGTGGTGLAFLLYGFKCQHPFFANGVAGTFIVYSIYTIYKALISTSAKERFGAIGTFCAVRFVLGVLQYLPKIGYHARPGALVFHVLGQALLLLGGGINALRWPEKHSWVRFGRDPVTGDRLGAEKAPATARNTASAASATVANGEEEEEEEKVASPRGFACVHGVGVVGHNQQLNLGNAIDYALNSHQLWHLLSMVASTCAYFGALHDSLDWREVVCDA